MTCPLAHHCLLWPCNCVLSSWGWIPHCSRMGSALWWEWLVCIGLALWAFCLQTVFGVSYFCWLSWQWRRRWVLLDDNSGEHQARRQLPSYDAHPTIASHMPEGRALAQLSLHRSRQHSKRDEKQYLRCMGCVASLCPEGHKPVSDWISIPACGPHPWVAWQVFFQAHRVASGAHVHDLFRAGKCIERGAKKLLNIMATSWLIVRLDPCEGIAWIGISKVPECACTPHQLGPVWPVGQMEAVCVGRILVEAENLDGWCASANLRTGEASAYSTPVFWPRPSKAHEFLGQVGVLAWSVYKLLIVTQKHDATTHAWNKESSLAATGQRPVQQLAELRSYVTGLDPGPSLEPFLQRVLHSPAAKNWLNPCHWPLRKQWLQTWKQRTWDHVKSSPKTTTPSRSRTISTTRFPWGLTLVTCLRTHWWRSKVWMRMLAQPRKPIWHLGTFASWLGKTNFPLFLVSWWALCKPMAPNKVCFSAAVGLCFLCFSVFFAAINCNWSHWPEVCLVSSTGFARAKFPGWPKKENLGHFWPLGAFGHLAADKLWDFAISDATASKSFGVGLWAGDRWEKRWAGHNPLLGAGSGDGHPPHRYHRFEHEFHQTWESV